MFRSQVGKLTHDVNEVLTRYIAIHDDIFPASWGRIIPIPGLFQAIDFRRHFIDITGIEISLQGMKAEAARLYETAPSIEKDYVATLCHYIAELLKTVSLFVRAIEKAKGKSDKGKKYGFIA
jgi:hypothetical protein